MNELVEMRQRMAELVASEIECQRVQEALRETRDYLENLFNYANAPIIVWDPTFRITRFNHAFERLTGHMADEVLGASLGILFPEDRREEAMAHIRRTTAGERWEVVEIPILRTDGAVRTVLWNSATLFAADGTTILATIAQGQDITERKRVEEALRETRDYLENLFDYANAPIIVWDPAFRITRFNHAFERLTGYTAGEVVGRELRLLFPEASRDESLSKIARALSGEYWESVEIPILRQDGETRLALWNSANIYAEDGTTLMATIAQGVDITARKQAEEALRQRTIELQARNEELDAFDHTVAHDLKGPLTLITGFAELLEDHIAAALDEEWQKCLHSIVQNGRKMSSIIDGLLLLAGVRKMEVGMGPLDMASMVAETQQRLAHMIEEHQAEIVLPAAWPVALGYGPWVEELWANYLSNAIKYGGRPPRVELGRRCNRMVWCVSGCATTAPASHRRSRPGCSLRLRALTRLAPKGTGWGCPSCGASWENSVGRRQ